MSFSSNNAKEPESDHWKTTGYFFSSLFNNNRNNMSTETPMDSSSSPSIDKCNRSPKEGDFRKDGACTKISKPECDNWKKTVEMFYSSFENKQIDMTKKNLLEPSSSSPSIDECNLSPKQGDLQKDEALTKLHKPECDQCKITAETLSSFFNNDKNDMTKKNLVDSSSSIPSIDQCNRSLKDLQKYCTKQSKSERYQWNTEVDSFSSFFNNNENDMTKKNPMKSSPSIDECNRSLKEGDLQKDRDFTKISKPKIDQWKAAVDTLSSFFDNNENDMTKKNLMEFSSSSPSIDDCNKSLKEGDLQKDGSCTQINNIEKQNLFVSPRHDYGDLKSISTALLEKFDVSDECINEITCKEEKMKDEWSQEEEDLLWSQIDSLRERNAVASETYRSRVRACWKSGTSVSFGSFVHEETVTTELLDYSSSSLASSIHFSEKDRSFPNCAA